MEDTRKNFEDLKKQFSEIMAKLAPDLFISPLEQVKYLIQVGIDLLKKPCTIYNTLNFPRTELMFHDGQLYEIKLPALGYTIPKKVDVTMPLSLSQTDDSFEIVHSKYLCKVDRKTGRISSFKWKFDGWEREICQEGKSLNRLIIHDDVPFFWDNWDIMHHAYETQRADLMSEEFLKESKVIYQTAANVAL